MHVVNALLGDFVLINGLLMLMTLDATCTRIISVVVIILQMKANQHRKKCKDFKHPRKMEHVTAQTWVLQNVDESLAELITKETKNPLLPF